MAGVLTDFKGQQGAMKSSEGSIITIIITNISSAYHMPSAYYTIKLQSQAVKIIRTILQVRKLSFEKTEQRDKGHIISECEARTQISLKVKTLGGRKKTKKLGDRCNNLS